MTLAWLPNTLTVSRCGFAVLVFWSLLMATGERPPDADAAAEARQATVEALWFQVAFLAFIAGAITDFLDGWVARNFNASSRFGVWLDPIADKLLVGLALMGLVLAFPLWSIVIPSALIIARDVFMTWLRTRPEGKRVVLPSGLAKLKTGVEMAAIIGLLAPLALVPMARVPVSDLVRFAASFTPVLAMMLLWFAAVLSLETARRYVKAIRRN